MAARRLSVGPAHTLELASEVLGLRGNPGAASKAVFTLLAADLRFAVDREGIWTLEPGREPPSPPLEAHRYAVVDVETTGGAYGRGDRITEIAIVPIEDGAIGECFHTLVNPGRPIPPWVQGLTGITDTMVAVAPPFEGIAEAVRDRLEGRIFVAHNAPFDWGFVQQELQVATGDVPDLRRLCTVRLGRFLLPRLRSHGLDALVTHYRIPVEDRHRAFGDALATATLLLHLFREAHAGGHSDLAGLLEALKGGGGRRPARSPAREGP